jgi:uncharacterized protein YndB with AHSA1/START domain
MNPDLIITVEALINSPIEKVWKYYNDPIHITKWAFASDDWEALHAENDLRTGGRFTTTMAAKDKSSKFDFSGTYTEVEEHKLIAYTMDGEDKRKVRTTFTEENGSVKVRTDFEMESENTRELQQEGWQAILNNFKKHCETS